LGKSNILLIKLQVLFGFESSNENEDFEKIKALKTHQLQPNEQEMVQKCSDLSGIVLRN
jgi:hypothetical protein